MTITAELFWYVWIFCDFRADIAWRFYKVDKIAHADCDDVYSKQKNERKHETSVKSRVNALI